MDFLKKRADEWKKAVTLWEQENANKALEICFKVLEALAIEWQTLGAGIDLAVAQSKGKITLTVLEQYLTEKDGAQLVFRRDREWISVEQSFDDQPIGILRPSDLTKDRILGAVDWFLSQALQNSTLGFASQMIFSSVRTAGEVGKQQPS